MKNSFILYTDLGPSILDLRDSDVGKLMKAIYRYVLYGEITPLKGSVKICFDMIRNHLDRDQAKYAETCQKRAEAGRKGGLSSGKRRANAELGSATEAENENENGNDNGNDNDNGNEHQNECADPNDHPNACDHQNASDPAADGIPSVSSLRKTYPHVTLGKGEYAMIRAQYPENYALRLKRLNDIYSTMGVPCDDPVGTLAIWDEQDRARGVQLPAFSKSTKSFCTTSHF